MVAVAPYCQALNVLGLVICNILYNSHCRPMKNFCSLNEETGLQSDGSEYLLRLTAAEIQFEPWTFGNYHWELALSSKSFLVWLPREVGLS